MNLDFKKEQEVIGSIFSTSKETTNIYDEVDDKPIHKDLDFNNVIIRSRNIYLGTDLYRGKLFATRSSLLGETIIGVIWGRYFSKIGSPIRYLGGDIIGSICDKEGISNNVFKPINKGVIQEGLHLLSDVVFIHNKGNSKILASAYLDYLYDNKFNNYSLVVSELIYRTRQLFHKEG